MTFNLRSIVITSLALAVAAIAHAGTYGEGGADDQLDVLSVGTDITYLTETEPFYVPTQSGSGYSDYAVTTNGTDYFNVNSFSEVPGGTGTAYEEAGYLEDLFFTNNGAYSEDVTISWEGFTTSSVYSTGYPDYSWDYSEAWVYVVGDVYEDASVDVASYGGGPLSGTDYDSDTITFAVAPGQEIQVQTAAYNEGYSTSSGVPGPTAVVPFSLGLIGAVRRRRKRS